MTEVKYIRACSVWRALEVIGDTPTLLILESAFLRVNRFDGFLSRTGILRSLLSNRLSKLVEAGCMEKKLYQERPKRYEYKLTEKGRGTYGIALMMLRWENKWGRHAGKIKVALMHKNCGHAFFPASRCSQCHENIDARSVRFEEGPGLAEMPQDYGRRRRQTSAAQNRQNKTTLFDTILAIIGDRWSALVLRSCFTGINTFDDILDDTGMATNILSERLHSLIDSGILVKDAYQERPTRYRYKLTEKGLDIYPIQLELIKWGDRWFASKEGPPVLLFHTKCNAPLGAVICCNHCGETLNPEDVEFQIHEPELVEEPKLVG